MRLTSHPDARAFLGAAQAVLERREAEHNLILGLALDMSGRHESAGEDPFCATVHEGDQLIAAAIMASHKPLVLAHLGGELGPAVELLARDLRTGGRDVPGVIGPASAAERFACGWSAIGAHNWRVSMRQRVYMLHEVAPMRAAPGGLRPAGEADFETVSRWLAAFEGEALGEGSLEQARAAAATRIGLGEIFLWEDDSGEPCAMAARVRQTRRGVAINAVYTPPGSRRRGFATACVARLSERLLGQGRSFCTLFTDLANPSSNSIYETIGYRPVCDFAHCLFEPRNGSV